NLPDDVGRAYTNLSFLAARNRKYALAVRYVEDGIAYATEQELFYRLYIMAARARVSFDIGDWDRAAEDAAFVVSQYGVAAVTKIWGLAVLGHLRVRRGDPGAVPLLDEAYQLAVKTQELQRVAPVGSARAELAWLKGDYGGVLNEARLVFEMAKGHDDPAIYEEFDFWLWRAGVITEPPKSDLTPYAIH